MPSVEFEPATPVSERPQAYVFDYAATGIGWDGTGASGVTGRRLTV